MLLCVISCIVDNNINTHYSSSLYLGVGLVSSLHIEPNQLALYWETFSVNNAVNELDDHTLQSFRNDVVKKADKDGAVVSRSALGKRNSSTYVTPPNKRGATGGGGDLKTPTSAVDKVAHRVSMSPNKVTPLGTSTTPAAVNLITYGERKNAGQVLVTFNPNDLLPMDSTDTEFSKPRCTISSDFSTNIQEPYRHMFTTCEERAQALDEHLEKMGQAMVTRYEIGKDDGIAELEAVGVPRQDRVCCIGRICNEVSLCVYIYTVCYFLNDMMYVKLILLSTFISGTRRTFESNFCRLGRIETYCRWQTCQCRCIRTTVQQDFLFTLSRTDRGSRRHECVGTQNGGASHL